MFRKKPTGTLAAGTKLAIHPMLDKVNCVGQKQDIAKILLFGRGDSDKVIELNGFDFAAADEFATAPACTKMKLEMNERKCGSVSNVNGVTARQVIKAALKYWNGPVTGNVATRVRSEWQWPANHPVTRFDTLGDHRFFEGWEYGQVGADGTVTLHARWFGS